MTLEKQIKEDMKSFMRSGEKEKLTIIRMLLADISNQKIELKKQDGELNDSQVKDIVRSFIKKIDEEIKGCELAKRDHSAQDAQKELLMKYLPTQLTTEQIEAFVNETIENLGATSKADMGKVMKALGSIRDSADMSVVSDMVKSKLA